MFWLDAKVGHFRKCQKYFYLENCLSYSADVKLMVNEDRFDFIALKHALSMCKL